jgi:hypothetical protein
VTQSTEKPGRQRDGDPPRQLFPVNSSQYRREVCTGLTARVENQCAGEDGRRAVALQAIPGVNVLYGKGLISRARILTVDHDPLPTHRERRVGLLVQELLNPLSSLSGRRITDGGTRITVAGVPRRMRMTTTMTTNRAVLF